MVLVPRPTPMFEVKVLLALFTYQFWPLAALFLLRVTVPKGNKKKTNFPDGYKRKFQDGW